MPLTDLAFKTTFTPYRKLIILGERIENKLIKSISPLNAELDYPDLTTFNIGNVSITLFDPDGNFNPNNPDNFWTAHWDRTDLPEHYNQVGYKSAVEIHIGYERDGTIESEKIFEGEVANIRVNLQPPEVIIEAVDASQNLRPVNVDDFGIKRRVLLPVNPEIENIGRYPFPFQSIPSEKSVSAETNFGKAPMTDVGTIRTEGALSPLNYQIANTAIETEGGQLPDDDLPVAIFKDVYRYKRVDKLVKTLLDAHGVNSQDIDILPMEAETEHFATYGRPGWELQNLPLDPLRQWRYNGYVKDVVYDSSAKKYYMLYGQRSAQVPDYIISYDVENDAWERVATTNKIINGATFEYEFWQLATKDFRTFFVLGTVYFEANDSPARGVYDSLDPSAPNGYHIQILKYERNGNTWTNVDNRAGNAPQLGFHYTKFPRNEGLNFTYPMLPDNRHSFAVKQIGSDDFLVYRGKEGIHTYKLSDNTKTTLKTIPNDSRRSMDFWIGDDNATTFFAWIEHGSDDSTLIIKDGNDTEIINKTYNDHPNPLISNENLHLFNDPLFINRRIPSRTGRLMTVSDMIYHNGYLYIVLQVTKGGTDVAETDSIGVLMQVDIANKDINIKKRYADFRHAARSPVIHQSEVYYFEGSHYQYRQVSDEEIDYPNNTGHLVQVLEHQPLLGAGVLDKGLCWRSAYRDGAEFDADLGFGRHGGTASPLVSDGEAIHLWTGYGDPERISVRPGSDGAAWLNDAPANDIDNYQWLQYGKKILQRIPILHTNGKKAWDLMNELARLTNATMSYRQGRFSFLPRATRQTTLGADLSVSATDAAVQDADRFDSNDGMVLINDELMSYKMRSSSMLATLTRGLEGSQPTAHKEGDTVLFVDALVFNHPDKRNLGSLKFKPDFHGIYNRLTAKLTPIVGASSSSRPLVGAISESRPIVGASSSSRPLVGAISESRPLAEISVESTESIAANGEKSRDFNFDLLSWHERQWAAVLLNAYLIETQQAQFEVELELPWSPHLKLGQTLVVDQQVVAHLRWTPVRILRISHDFDARTTRVTGRTFGLRRISQTKLAFRETIPSFTFVVDKEITPFVLPEAKGGLGTLEHGLSQLPPGLLSEDQNVRTVSGTPTQTGTWLMTYTATDMSTVPQTAQLRFQIKIVDPVAFDGEVPDNLLFQQGCHIDYQLPPASGGVGQIYYEAMGLPTFLNFDMNTRRITGIMQEIGRFGIQYSAWDSAPSPTYVSQGFNIIGEREPQWATLIAPAGRLTPTAQSKTHIAILSIESSTVRAFDSNGNRVPAEDLVLAASPVWTGAVMTADRRIFVSNSDNEAFFYNLNAFGNGDRELPTERIQLGTGDWQDVCMIGTDKLGFLDRETGAVRVYGIDRTRLADEDITFGFDAEFRSIAANADGTKLYVLVENLGALLVWDISSGAFDYDETITLIEGTADWQKVALHPDGHLLLIRSDSIRAIAFDGSNRDEAKDLELR